MNVYTVYKLKPAHIRYTIYIYVCVLLLLLFLLLLLLLLLVLLVLMLLVAPNARCTWRCDMCEPVHL